MILYRQCEFRHAELIEIAIRGEKMTALMWTFATVGILIFIGSNILDWIYEPPMDPPVVVIKRQFGKILWARTARNWVIVIPYVHSIETMELKRFTSDVKPTEVLTPDNVSLGISVTLYFRNDPSEQGILAFMESGKTDGVKKIVSEIAEQEIRQWARNPNEPPHTWQEAQSSQDGLTKKLHDKIISQCNGLVDDKDGKLPKFGVFLEQVTIGPISPLDENLRKEKELVAREELQKKAELADTITKLEMAQLIAKKCHISNESALKFIMDNELIKAGHGGVYRGDFSSMLAAAAGKFLGGDKK